MSQVSKQPLRAEILPHGAGRVKGPAVAEFCTV
jgi:hypothetical protein